MKFFSQFEKNEGRKTPVTNITCFYGSRKKNNKIM